MHEHNFGQTLKLQRAVVTVNIRSRSFKYNLQTMYLFLFVCFVALRPKSTAMVIAGRSVHLTTLFPGQA